MFNDDFDEFRARSYSGGFLCVPIDNRRCASDPSSCSEPTQTGNDVTATDVRVSETHVLPGRVGGRRHSDEMTGKAEVTAGCHSNGHLLARQGSCWTAGLLCDGFVIRMRCVETSCRWTR